MKAAPRIWLIAATMVFIGFAAHRPVHASGGQERSEAKYIVIMVPDGMGLADVTAARIFRNGIDGPPLRFETLDRIGYQRTRSADSAITDSAAAASAWACGEKFNNGEICFHRDGRTHPPSILEMAKDRGMAAGLVATSTITHATPAAFGAHVISRDCETEIARQYIETTRPEILLGGGSSKFNPAKADACGTAGNYLQRAANSGYRLASTRTELDAAVSDNATRLLGLFSAEGMTPEHKRSPGIAEPRLPEMVSAALRILENGKNGFFLMVEGSQIDWGNHANDMRYKIGEILAFDDAVKVVLDWIEAVPGRKERTLLIVSPDHETGGFTINGPSGLPGKGKYVEAGWATKGHTGTDVPVWSQGPGSHALGRAIDNTDLYRIMRDALK